MSSSTSERTPQLSGAARAVFYTWLFVHSGGSVLITIIAHASEGLIVREFVGTDGWSGADETQYAVIYTAAWCVIAIGLLVFDRQMWRTRDRAASATHNRAVARVERSPALRPSA